MKTPDEIKKGLECCTSHVMESCNDCPYTHISGCARESTHDALTLIHQLQADNARQARCIENMTDMLNAAHDETAKLKVERDQAVEDLRNLKKLSLNVSNCVFCLHFNHGEGDKACIECGIKGVDRWQWRGAKAVNEDG